LTPRLLDPFHFRRWIAMIFVSSAVTLLLVGRPVSAVLESGVPDALTRFDFARLHMGTVVRIVLYAPHEPGARSAADAAFARIEELESILSHFREDSEVNRLSRDGYRGNFEASPALFEVLQQSRHFSEMTQGAFDVTVGPLVALWREARRQKALPARDAIDQARGSVGFSRILLQPGGTVRLGRPDMKLDLSAIAKGYIADEALQLLRGQGIERALLDAGGDIVTSGSPPGKAGWSVQVSNFAGGGDAGGVIVLKDRAVATSGDGFQFVEIDGIRYSHIVDPKTGIGLRRSVTATVVAPNGTTADALATALSVLVPEEALRLVESLAGVEAYIVRRGLDGVKRFQSSGFPP
jgi:FAD:protein FMN transferase